ncbi:MAG TPA: GAF domain-containing SpoIIE family protein phosphatase [Candidatus Deferrimicrobium sp.]|nr:GAF domain-containing SpoIIE family protein phosphatase [Candidatus Deferrimicrobium sp.]
MAVPVDVDDRINELEARLAATKAQLRDLSTMGAVITSIHEIDSVLSVVMDMAIRLVDGEVGLIMLEEAGELTHKISWGVDEKLVRSVSFKDGLDLPSYCFKACETVILNELGIKADNGPTIDSIICLPIHSAEKRHGVMVILNKAEGNRFGVDDREALEMLLSFVAVAMDNSLLMKDRLNQQKVEQEMAIARQIQETILPQDVDSIPGVEIGAVYTPARQVGGDFYNILRLDDWRFVIVLGDVSNKGVPAALVMAAASGIISSLLSDDPAISVAELARRLNDLMIQDIIKDREMFVSLFFARFDLHELRITYCNAGHLPGLFWDSENQKVMELSTGGPIVGQFPKTVFQQGERQLKSGDRLFIFTDGLTEATDIAGTLFGRPRTEDVFRSLVDLPPKEFCFTIKERVDRFAQGASEETRDDFTVFLVKVK